MAGSRAWLDNPILEATASLFSRHGIGFGHGRVIRNKVLKPQIQGEISFPNRSLGMSGMKMR